ncbi:hypothetical protein J3R83DRAFT_5474 [Lanmaoa asiatica]|nr:hypothetical protein J3R83DRAFT_5474 [Lanmaoa asiatica]
MLFTHNTTPSAYPPDRTQGLYPFNIYYLWLSSEFDQVIYDATRMTASTLQAQVTDSSQGDAASSYLSQLCHFRYTTGQLVWCEPTEITGNQSGGRPGQGHGSRWWFQVLMLFLTRCSACTQICGILFDIDIPFQREEKHG